MPKLRENKVYESISAPPSRYVIVTDAIASGNYYIQMPMAELLNFLEEAHE